METVIVAFALTLAVSVAMNVYALRKYESVRNLAAGLHTENDTLREALKQTCNDVQLPAAGSSHSARADNSPTRTERTKCGMSDCPNQADPNCRAGSCARCCMRYCRLSCRLQS